MIKIIIALKVSMNIYYRFFHELLNNPLVFKVINYIYFTKINEINFFFRKSPTGESREEGRHWSEHSGNEKIKIQLKNYIIHVSNDKLLIFLIIFFLNQLIEGTLKLVDYSLNALK